MRMLASVFLFSLAPMCFGQALIEHAAAAAGGTTGALAGKPVGQSLSKIFGNVEKTTAKAAKATAEPPKQAEDPNGEANRTFGAAVNGEGMPASFGGVTRHNRPVKAAASVALEAKPLPGSEAAPVAAPIPVPVHRTSREDVLAIQAGTQRTDVLAKLGKPSSSVTIPDDGHLLEIFKYVSDNRWIGTVRLDNGAVVRVDSAQ